MTNILGGGIQASNINYTPAGFTSPGFSGSYSGGGVNITNSPGLNSAIGNLQSTFGSEANAFNALGNTVKPGFSQLRTAGLNQLNTQQQATVSNLTQNLANRKVLGSSFANNNISNTEAEFAQQKANFAANSYLQEFQAYTQATQERYQAQAQQYYSFINQSNIESGLAAQLSQQNNQIMANIATADAGLQQQASVFNAQQNMAAITGVGKAIGTVAGLGVGGGATIGGSIFNSLATGSGSNAPAVYAGVNPDSGYGQSYYQNSIFPNQGP